MTTGLRIPRRYTTEGADPYSTIEWARRDSRITNPDGSVVFEVLDAEVPASWSQVATDIVVSKYFRKAGVPQTDADGNPVLDGDGNPVLGSETSGRQVFDRLATTWRWWGEKHGYFASSQDAQAFEDELKFMLASQIAAPNSPQWFNTGLNYSYGLTRTPGPHLTLALSHRSPMISSAPVGSWTCGCVKRASSSSEVASVPTFPTSVALKSRFPGEANHQAL
jgi:ribonucleoside-diphosphate reductase alpha chain